MKDEKPFKEKIEQERLKRIFSADETDQMLNIARPRMWWVFCLVLLLLGGVVAWAFLGKIPTEVEGRGVVLSSKGVFAVASKAKGTVAEVFVQEGEEIREKQPLMRLHHPERRATLKKIETTLNNIDHVQVELEVLNERLIAREELFKEGLIPKTVFEDTKIAVIEKQISIQEANAELSRLFSELEKNSPGLKRSIHNRTFFEMLLKEQKGFDSLEEELSVVQSPGNGKVLELLVNTGDLVGEDEQLLWVERLAADHEGEILLCGVPVQVQDRIRQEMLVRIEPTIVNPQEYGVMLGVVQEVSPYVVSEEDLQSSLHNPQLVKYLMGESPGVTRVIVKPILDEGTPSGFKWTSGKGPPFPIPTGTLCTIKIIVEEQAPITYLIPIWKFHAS